MLYRIEFKEKDGSLHLERMDGNHKPNTFGWVTLKDNVTDDYGFTYFAMIEPLFQNKELTLQVAKTGIEVLDRIIRRIKNPNLDV